LPSQPESDETRRLAVDVRLPPPTASGALRGYVLAYVCDEEHGECRYLRRDFRVEVRRPGR